jgi:hypothetical protein
MFEATGGIGNLTYLGGWEITRCPEAKFTLPAFRNGGALPHDPYTLYSSYCFNGVTPGYDNVPETATRTFFERRRIGSTDKRVPRKLTDIQFPSSIIMFQDGSEVMLDAAGPMVATDDGVLSPFTPSAALVMSVRSPLTVSHPANAASSPATNATADQRTSLSESGLARTCPTCPTCPCWSVRPTCCTCIEALFHRMRGTRNNPHAHPSTH